jgi:ATP-dependent RNA/DNA helicase IGHMBP2
MDLDQHLDRLGALLDRERAAEKDRFARLPLPERIRKGLGLDDVEAVEEAGLAGRSLVTYARPGGRELGAPQIGVGSIVRVLPRRDPSDDAPAGIVARPPRARQGQV